MTQEQIAKSLASIEQKLDLQNSLAKLGLALDQRSYLSRKVQAGEAILDKGAFYQMVAPLGTFSLTVINFQGYVWIAHIEGGRFSQDAIFTMTILHDDEITPFQFYPAAFDNDQNWVATVPYAAVTKETATITLVNNDPLWPHWVIGYWVGTYLRKDVWERDLAYLAKASREYEDLLADLGPPPPPSPPGA